MKKNKQSVLKLTMMSTLLAITIVLQAVASAFTMPITNTPVALALIPIAVGAIIYGPTCGGILGLGWSLFILVSGQADFYFGMNAIGTIVTVVSKGTLAGIVTGLVYNLIKKKNYVVAIIVASIMTPLINSLVYRVGLVVFFNDFFFGGAGNQNPIAYFMVAFVSVSFFVELGISALFSPLIVRICDICFAKLGISVQSKQKNKVQ